MTFDYKKAYKEFYLPPQTPGIVTVPAMNFLAVRGEGDPNEEDGAYKQALGMLYAVAYTIKWASKSPRVTSTMWCRLWRAFGGKKVFMVQTIPARQISVGFRSSACRSL